MREESYEKTFSDNPKVKLFGIVSFAMLLAGLFIAFIIGRETVLLGIFIALTGSFLFPLYLTSVGYYGWKEGKIRADVLDESSNPTMVFGAPLRVGFDAFTSSITVMFIGLSLLASSILSAIEVLKKLRFLPN